MDKDSKYNEKSSGDQAIDSKFVYDTRTNVSSAYVDKRDAINTDKSKNVQEHSQSDGDTKSMRIILPVFLENEQKYAQVERKRKIHSSPAKSMRRFSQDSAYTERQLNVSWTEHLSFGFFRFLFDFSLVFFLKK